jgi:hypothetical protein
MCCLRSKRADPKTVTQGPMHFLKSSDEVIRAPLKMKKVLKRVKGPLQIKIRIRKSILARVFHRLLR